MNYILLSLLLLAMNGCTSTQRSISCFSFPWSDKPVPKTDFRAWTENDRLHFIFIVEDADIIVSETWIGESTLDDEDRIEVFFAKDAALKDYWCLEIDTLGRVHDYHAQHYRKFDSTWNCPGLITAATRTATGYEVCASLPLTTLSALLGKPIACGSDIRIGLFRAEFYGQANATHGEANDNWLSWVRPDVKQPDFHIPSAFRVWRLP
jgi:hypothetical protein